MDSPMMEYAFFQGRIVPFADAKISIGTHTVQYGTGAFAGIRGYLDDGGGSINIFRLPDHAERLLNSARLLRAELPFDRDSLAATIVSLVERNAPTGDVYIRPFVYKPAVQLTPRLRGLGDDVAIYMLAMGDYLSLDRGQRALVSSWFRIPDNAIPSRGKLIGAYVNSALAKDEAEEKGGDEAIMLNTAGKVAEGSGCNLFIVRRRHARHAADHRRHPGGHHAPLDAPDGPATRASLPRSARSTGPSCTSPTRRSSAGRASRSPGSSPSTDGPWARGRSGRSPRGSGRRSSTRSAGDHPATPTGSPASAPTPRPARRWWDAGRPDVRRAVRLGLVGLLAGCAAMESAPPERLAELRASAQACGEALPAVTSHDVDRFGNVRVSAGGPEAEVIERNFRDCMARRGRWTTWTPGQLAPMLEPPGTENPDPRPALRVP